MPTAQINDAKQNNSVTVQKIKKPDAEWKRLLTKKLYGITTKKGTKAPVTCQFEVHEPVISQCLRNMGIPKQLNRLTNGNGHDGY